MSHENNKTYKQQFLDMLKREHVKSLDKYGNVQDIEYGFETSVLNYLPDSVFKSIIVSVDERTELHHLINSLASTGKLAFDPFIIKEGLPLPVLALRYNKYLHLNRGAQFEVSYTANGKGSCSDGCVDLEWLYNSIHLSWIGTYTADDSDLYQALLYINAMSACNEYDNFHRLLYSIHNLFDEYVKLIAESRHLCENYTMTYQKLRTYIVPIPDISHYYNNYDHVFRVAHSDTLDYCRIRTVTKDHGLVVTLEVMNGGRPEMFAVNLPNCLKPDIVGRLPSDKRADYIAHCNEFYRTRGYIDSVVMFLLNSFDFVINNLTCYPRTDEAKNNKMKALNDPGVKVLSKLSDISDCYIAR